AGSLNARLRQQEGKQVLGGAASGPQSRGAVTLHVIGANVSSSYSSLEARHRLGPPMRIVPRQHQIFPKLLGLARYARSRALSIACVPRGAAPVINRNTAEV